MMRRVSRCVVVVLTTVLIIFNSNYKTIVSGTIINLGFFDFFVMSNNKTISTRTETISVKEIEIHNDVIKTFYDRRRTWNTSNLGNILFRNANYKQYKRDAGYKTFVVLIWQHWDWLKNRHLYNFGSKNDFSTTEPLEDCSVKNCIFSGDKEYLNTADAVVIHMQKKLLPNVLKRNPKQRWIFLNDESPINMFSLARNQNNNNVIWKDMNNIFNWTMDYRSDSDIPVPYGRTVPLIKPINIDKLGTNDVLEKLVPYWKWKHLDSRSIVIISHCIAKRMKFINKLQKFIKVDIIGRCSDVRDNKNKCPGHFKADCILPAIYLFYLVLENSKCHQYITEKIFQHAYSKGAIPIIMGPSLKDCSDLLPPNSYLHVDNYKDIEELAIHMSDITRDLEKILHFHMWRRHFTVLNEHGYFKTKSYHLCRVCEALNYNDVAVKSYDEHSLSLFYNKKILCDLNYKVLESSLTVKAVAKAAPRAIWTWIN